MSRYIAFDVETPNRFSDRMSAIGISVIENGAVADSYWSTRKHISTISMCS